MSAPFAANHMWRIIRCPGVRKVPVPAGEWALSQLRPVKFQPVRSTPERGWMRKWLVATGLLLFPLEIVHSLISDQNP